ncbi:MAG: hypothetical protein ACTSW1_19580 [Candidatus Hodarchaeales archaeon]
MSLSVQERKLILKLIEEPLISTKKMAEVLDRSRPTITTQFKRLEPKCKVQAFLDLPKLGLKRVTLILKANYKNLPLLEKILSLFPYSMYRARIIGEMKGLLVQLAMPTFLSIESFIKILINNGVIDNYKRIIAELPPVVTHFQLEHYLEEKNDFVFDWRDFNQSIKQPETQYPIERPILHSEKILKEIEPIDMVLLASLSENARKKGVELLSPAGETYSEDIPPYAISKHIKWIKDKHLIKYYKVQLDWELFDIYQALLFYSPGPLPMQKINSLAKNIKEKFPFDSIFHPINFSPADKQSGFYWLVAIPPSHFPSLSSAVWEFAEDNWECYSINYKSSARFAFYGHHNFDFTSRTWKTSDEYLFGEILKLF